ncbi:MAG TPA: ABC transporter permease [Bryobacteraceae bacterium]|nr:ABC transporter permease [Bryobacteraceae bacterium]
MQQLRYAGRLLARTPGFTIVAVITLALGIGVNSAIFSVIDAVLLRPLPYPHPERLVSFYEYQGNDPDERGGLAPASMADYNRNHVFTGIAHVGLPGMNLTGAGTPERIFGIKAGYNFLDILGVRPALGRGFRPEEDRYGAPRLVIISHELWQQRLGGDPAVIGRTITLDGERYEVIGVLPAGFRSPDEISRRQPALFVLPDCWPPNILHNRGEHYDHAIARLKPGVTLAQARSEMETIAGRLAKAYPGTNREIKLGVAPLGADMVRRVRTALLVLLGAVGLVLLIACANVANLLLARAAGRSREVAIRLALGAGRRRIVRELLVESALLAVLGCVLGLLLGVWTRDLLVSTAPTNIPRLDTATLNWRVLGFTGLLATLTVFLFGMVPAWQVSGVRPNLVLKSGERSTGGSTVLRWRSALMAAEVALALMLMVGGALLWKSFLRATGVDLGFQPDRVVMMKVDLPHLRYPDGGRRLAFFQELAQRVERLPGVQSAGFTFCGPMRGSWGSVYETPEGPGSEPDYRLRDADFEPVSPRYFETLGIPILKGRGFTPADREGAPPVAVINRVLARKLFPHGEAAGHRIRRAGARDWETIVGVVGEVHLQGQTEKVQAQIYFPAAQTSLYPVHLADFAIHTAGAPLAIVRDVQRQVWAIDKDQPVTRVETLEEVVSASVAQRRFQAALLLLFAGVALALAVIGVYGVISYAIAQRTPEIGLRLALGAQPNDILGLTVARALRPILAGLAAGLAGALAASRLLASLLFEVKPSDPAAFALAGVLLAAVALGACLIPARRATRVDPMVALRYE